MKNVACLSLLFLLVSCSPMKITYTQSTEPVDFSKYKTFNFYELKASGDTISKDFAERTSILKSAIATEMNKRGYVQTNNNADLLLNIGIVVREQTQTRQTDFRTDAPKYMGQRNYSWKSEELILGYYREGAVSLDVVDAKENKAVWKASIEGIVPSKKSSLQRQAENGMKRLFAKYPVNEKK
jgi:hypothetical protein